MKIYNVRFFKNERDINKAMSITLFEPSLDVLKEKMKKYISYDVTFKKWIKNKEFTGQYKVFRTDIISHDFLFNIFITKEEVENKEIINAIGSRTISAGVEDRNYLEWVDTVNGRVYMPIPN